MALAVQGIGGGLLLVWRLGFVGPGRIGVARRPLRTLAILGRLFALVLAQLALLRGIGDALGTSGGHRPGELRSFLLALIGIGRCERVLALLAHVEVDKDTLSLKLLCSLNNYNLITATKSYLNFNPQKIFP